MWKVQVSSSRSMLVTPGTFRACWMLAPCVPMARPIKSSRTANCSWNLDASCRELCRHTHTHTLQSLAKTKQPKHQPINKHIVCVDGDVYLQLSAGLFVSLHEWQFGAETPEVHVADHVGPLGCDLVHGLQTQRSNQDEDVNFHITWRRQLP